ncbi:MAG: type II toxin-antitoxin system HigB family toxin [Spirochaetia bacterium]|nr:type II toxin-antitoxin system HigB family toxin [Spirochaetia bacterium]
MFASLVGEDFVQFAGVLKRACGLRLGACKRKKKDREKRARERHVVFRRTPACHLGAGKVKEGGHGDAEKPLKAWFHVAKSAEWRTPQDIKRLYPSASFLKNNRVVFNIGGNKFRLIVAIKYDFNLVLIRFVGTHEEYNKIDAEEI